MSLLTRLKKLSKDTTSKVVWQIHLPKSNSDKLDETLRKLGVSRKDFLLCAIEELEQASKKGKEWLGRQVSMRITQ